MFWGFADRVRPVFCKLGLDFAVFAKKTSQNAFCVRPIRFVCRKFHFRSKTLSSVLIWRTHAPLHRYTKNRRVSDQFLFSQWVLGLTVTSAFVDGSGSQEGAQGVSVRSPHQWDSKPCHRKSIASATHAIEFQGGGASMLDKARA